jgi:hypothetical protein
MRTSESIIKLAHALLGFQSEVGKIKKEAKNTFFGKYASLSSVLDTIDPVLSKCGIVVIQSPSGDGKSIQLITTIIEAESGEFIESEFSMVPVKQDPQGMGSCITYMRRYALASILKLNVDDDDDGNSASNVGASSPKKSYNAPFVPPKKVATDMDIQDLGLRFMEANDLESLRSTYIAIVKDVKAKYSNADEVVNKLEIMKDEIKERFK